LQASDNDAAPLGNEQVLVWIGVDRDKRFRVASRQWHFQAFALRPELIVGKQRYDYGKITARGATERKVADRFFRHAATMPLVRVLSLARRTNFSFQ
jgi:hypothetical protein